MTYQRRQRLSPSGRSTRCFDCCRRTTPATAERGRCRRHQRRSTCLLYCCRRHHQRHGRGHRKNVSIPAAVAGDPLRPDRGQLRRLEPRLVGDAARVAHRGLLRGPARPDDRALQPRERGGRVHGLRLAPRAEFKTGRQRPGLLVHGLRAVLEAAVGVGRVRRRRRGLGLPDGTEGRCEARRALLAERRERPDPLPRGAALGGGHAAGRRRAPVADPLGVPHRF